MEHHVPIAIVAAERIVNGLLSASEAAKRIAKEKLRLVIEMSNRSRLARLVRARVNRLWRDPMSDQDLAGEIVAGFYSEDPAVRTHAINTTRLLGEMGAWVYDDIAGIYDETQCLLSESTVGAFGYPDADELMGFGWGDVKAAAKKAASKAGVHKASKAITKAAKAVKKHDFKKDIAVANKVGKIVGPLAASAPPPYGPAIAGACMVLDMADKYNKTGEVSAADMNKALAAAGVEDAEQYQEILTVAQNIKNQVKATDLIDKVATGDVAAIAKMKEIKDMAKQGNAIAKGAMEALAAANLGRKMPTEQKIALVKKAGQGSAKATAMQRAIKKARVIYTPQGEAVHVLSPSTAGVAMEIAIARKRRAG